MASPNRRVALLAPGAVLIVIVAIVVALVLHHQGGESVDGKVGRSGSAGPSVSRTEGARTATSIPDKTARDWVSFADHVVLAESTGGSLRMSVTYWSRQGAHLLPDVISGLGPSPAGAYLVPLVWLPDGGGEWAVLGQAVPVKHGALAPAASTGWIDKSWSGKAPQKVAHTLYATKPYPAALPLLGKDVHTRVKAVAEAG